MLPFEISVDTREPGGALKLKTLYKINRFQKLLAQYPQFSEPVSVAEGIKFFLPGSQRRRPEVLYHSEC